MPIKRPITGREVGAAFAYLLNPPERMPGEDILDYATRTTNWVKARDVIFERTQRSKQKPSKEVAEKDKKGTLEKRGGLKKAAERKKATEKAVGIKKKIKKIKK